MNPYKETIETWNKLAEMYEAIFMDIELYNASYDFFCQSLSSESSSILELGSGPGNVTRHIRKHLPKAQIDSTDVSENMTNACQKNNPDVKCFTLDARDLHLINESYDGILIGLCIPYLAIKDLKVLISNTYSKLNEKGVIYLSGIEGLYDQSGFETGSTGDRAYVYYYPSSEIKTILKENKFSILKCFNVPYLKNDGSTQIHWIVIARKN